MIYLFWTNQCCCWQKLFENEGSLRSLEFFETTYWSKIFQLIWDGPWRGKALFKALLLTACFPAPQFNELKGFVWLMDKGPPRLHQTMQLDQCPDFDATSFWRMFTFLLHTNSLEAKFAKIIHQIKAQESGFPKIAIFNWFRPFLGGEIKMLSLVGLFNTSNLQIFHNTCCNFTEKWVL